MDHHSARARAIHAVDLDGVTLDGRHGAPAGLRPGAVWRSRRAAWRIAALPGRGGALPGGGVTLRGPGGGCWRAALVALGPGAVSGSGWIAVFHGAAPPAGRDLVVAAVTPPRASRAPTRGAAGLSGALLGPETVVETEAGPVAAADLRPGDRLLTEAGPVPLRSARLVLAAPALLLPGAAFGAPGPARPLRLGPDTLVAIEGRAVQALFGLAEALLRVGDLALLPGVRRAPPRPMLALGLDHARLIMADGVACCLPPPGAAPSALPMRLLGPDEAQIVLARPAPCLSLRRTRPRTRPATPERARARGPA